MTKPESNLGFAEGAIFGMSQLHKEEDMKVFDWNKAANYIKEHKVKNAEAGLQGDWNYTGGSIFSNGQVDTDAYTYLESSWAVPHLYDLDTETMIPCYVTPDANLQKWDAGTKWPESALKIINDET